MIILRSVLLRMRSVSDKSCKENQNAYFMFQLLFSRESFRLCENVQKFGRIEQATDENITWQCALHCWIPKATNTHSEHVILIAFPRQQLLHERPALLRYTYIACLVLYWGANSQPVGLAVHLPFTPYTWSSIHILHVCSLLTSKSHWV